MKHAAIIEVQLRHGYYADGACSDLALRPTSETAQLLRSHRCLVQESASGLRVVTQLDASGQIFLPLPAESRLRFQIEIRNPDFFLFTDLTHLANPGGAGAQTTPLFTTAGVPAESAGELRLTAGSIKRPRGPFAEIELRIEDLPRRAFTPVFASFRVSFAARRARWAYYSVTDTAANTSELRIVDASPAGTADVLSFGAANRTLLNEAPDPSDPVAAQLLARYPTLRCVRHLSDAAVACRKEPRQHLELRLGDERLSGPLPNPSLRNASSGDVLFQIIKYRTQPFANQ